MQNVRIAIPTKGRGGLEDAVSEVFGRSKTFTLIGIEAGVVKNVKVVENPAVSYKHGAGPIVVKMLVDSGVNVVLSGELGPGASALLEQYNIKMIKVKPSVSVSDTVREVSWSTIDIEI